LIKKKGLKSAKGRGNRQNGGEGNRSNSSLSQGPRPTVDCGCITAKPNRKIRFILMLLR